MAASDTQHALERASLATKRGERNQARRKLPPRRKTSLWKIAVSALLALELTITILFIAWYSRYGPKLAPPLPRLSIEHEPASLAAAPPYTHTPTHTHSHTHSHFPPRFHPHPSSAKSLYRRYPGRIPVIILGL